MKKIIYSMFSLYGAFISSVNAADETTNILGLSNDNLKQGNITFSDIPKAITNVTSFILGFAATIAMIMIIVGGLKYSLGTMNGSAPNKSDAEKTIKFGIMGFVVSVSSWFVIKLVIENF